MKSVEKKTYTENPFSLLKIVIPVLVVTFIVAVIAVSNFGVPVDKRGGPTTKEGFITMLVFVHLIVFLIVFFTCSFLKNRTINCYEETCEISGSDLWGISNEDENIKWREITHTFFTVTSIRGGEQLNFVIRINDEKDVRLLSKSRLNSNDFNSLIETFNEKTPHLPYEWKKKSDVGDRKVIDNQSNYYKVSRNLI